MISEIFDGKTLLITGGTGSFGNAVLRRFLHSGIGEIHQLVIGLLPFNPRQLHAVAQQESMAHDFSLLLDPIAFQRQARLQTVIISAGKGAAQDQVPGPAGLHLPDVNQFMDEMPLQGQAGRAEIVAIAG